MESICGWMQRAGRNSKSKLWEKKIRVSCQVTLMLMGREVTQKSLFTGLPWWNTHIQVSALLVECLFWCLACSIYKSTHTHTHTRRRKGDVCVGLSQISDCRCFFSIVMVNCGMRPLARKECAGCCSCSFIRISCADNCVPASLQQLQNDYSNTSIHVGVIV